MYASSSWHTGVFSSTSSTSSKGNSKKGYRRFLLFVCQLSWLFNSLNSIILKLLTLNDFLFLVHMVPPIILYIHVVLYHYHYYYYYLYIIYKERIDLNLYLSF
ncbi:hypothetical protein Dimus_027816 [Dionaea muscipula]